MGQELSRCSERNGKTTDLQVKPSFKHIVALIRYSGNVTIVKTKNKMMSIVRIHYTIGLTKHVLTCTAQIPLYVEL